MLQTPGNLSNFEGWGIECSGTGDCNITMNGPKSVTAICTLAPLAMNITTGTPYATLSDALSGAATGAELDLRDTEFDGIFTLNKALILKGGRNILFSAWSGLQTILPGELLVQSGDSTLETTDVVGRLNVQGGSLKVKGVQVR